MERRTSVLSRIRPSLIEKMSKCPFQKKKKKISILPLFPKLIREMPIF